MLDINFCSPTRIVLGKDTELKTGELIRQYGGTRVLLHYGGNHARKSGLIDRVKASIEAEDLYVVELGGVVPNPRLSLVREGIELCRKEKIDFIMAVGGGSVIDSAKAIAMGSVYDGDVWEFFIEDNGVVHDVPQKSLPIGVVLTIAATGSEASNSCVITNTDDNLKRFCDNDINRPRFAIENPDLTSSLPPFQTACSIVDIMSHSFERYFTAEEGGNELTDRLCEAIFSTCISCGKILMENPLDYNARANVMLASTLSHNGLTGLGRSGDWSSHFIEHELSGEYDVTHGAGLAVITPAWMKYVWRDRPEKFISLAHRVMGVPKDFGTEEEIVLEAIKRLEDFFSYMGLAIRLEDMPEISVPVTEEAMYKMARRVRITNTDGTVGGFKRLGTEDIVNIFKLSK